MIHHFTALQFQPSYIKSVKQVKVESLFRSCLVVELDGAGDGLGEGEAGGLGGDGAQLVPFLLGHVLGHQAVLGLDVGEVARHVAAEIGIERLIGGLASIFMLLKLRRFLGGGNAYNHALNVYLFFSR